MGVKVLVRATVELSGFPRGHERVADIGVPRVRQMLDAGYVVLVNPADEKLVRAYQSQIVEHDEGDDDAEGT